MSKSRCRDLLETGDKLFSARSALLGHWQDIAEQFHPERADFTTAQSFGTDFAGHLMSGYPALQMRELSDQLAAMLRPRQKLWAKLTASSERIDQDTQARQWLEAKSEVMRRAMYVRDAQFLRATKTGDKDFVAFGQAVIQPRLRRDRAGLLFTCWHLRDTVWAENADQKIESVHRCYKFTARQIVQNFPKTASDEIRRAAEKEPHKEFECRHIVIPSDQYDLEKNANKERFPYVSLYVVKEGEHVLEEVPQKRLGYVIPRWNLGALGQYATSPATMLALPDGRLLQTMTASLLEAGERAVTPPLIATHEVVRSDMQNYPGGVTWVDREYDERLGEALRPIEQDLSGLQFGLKMLEDVREVLKQIFFLNKINLPEFGKDMTAFEVQKRVEEYVRSALPLFEPMEVEYNGALCEETFEILLENGGFGPPENMPEILRGADVRFEFESPLQATAGQAKAQAFMRAAEMQQIAAQLDPTTIHTIDVAKAYSDALDGIEVPADWKRDPKEIEYRIAQAQQAQAEQSEMAQIAQGAGVAEQVGKAAQSLTAMPK